MVPRFNLPANLPHFQGSRGGDPLDPEIKFLAQKLWEEILITYYLGFCDIFIFSMKIRPWQESAVGYPP